MRRYTRIVALAVLTHRLAATDVNAAANSWTDGSAKWETASNWSLGVAPSILDAGDLITNAGNKTVTIDATTVGMSPNTLSITNLTVCGTSSSTNTLSLNNAGGSIPLDILNSLTITTNGAVLVTNSALIVSNLSGGVFNVDGSLVLYNGGSIMGTSNSLIVASTANVTGTVWITGGQLTATNNLTYVGYSGIGAWTVSNGLWQAQLVRIGYTSGARGTLTMAGGTNVLSGNLNMGYFAGAKGTIWLTGGELLVTNGAAFVGYGSSGQMTVSNGIWRGDIAYVGENTGSQGTLTLAGGTSSLSSFLEVGGSVAATGAVWLTGGELDTTNATSYMGDGGVGQMVVSNGLWLAQSIRLGTTNIAQGTLTIAGGTVTLPYSPTSYLSVGYQTYSATDTVWVTGGKLIATNSTTTIDIGDSGVGQMVVSNGTVSASTVHIGTILNFGQSYPTPVSGTLTIAGGTMSVSSLLDVSRVPNATSTVWVTGGQLNVNNTPLVVGVLGLAQMTVSNGTVDVGELVVTNNLSGSVVNTNLLNFVGGTISSAGAAITNGLAFDIGDGVHPATYQLVGGVHSFANGVEVFNNSSLLGSGTINGNAALDAGSTVLANGGGNLDFFGVVTNNTTVLAIDGTALNFYGPVVNNGVINATNGGAQFYGGIVNTGTILTGPETNSWNDRSGKWETATNWSRAAAPSITDLADVIADAGNNTITIDAATAGNIPSVLTISNLIVTAPLNMTNTLLLSSAGTNAPLVVFNGVHVNNGGSVLLTNSALQVGGSSGGALTVDGLLTMDSGVIWVSSNLLVGLSNPLGLVTIRGGDLYVTNAAHTAVTEVRYGTLMLTGGVYFTDSLLITNTGASFVNNGGTFTITGQGQVDQGTQTVASGTTQLSSNLVVGASANSTGTVNVTGGQLVVTNAPITIGDLGVGNMTVSSGTVSTAEVDIGAGTNSQGTLTLQDGSAVTVSSNLTAGSASGATGAVNVAGGQLVATNGVIGVGNSGTLTSGTGVGTMTVSNSMVLADQILLGSSVGGQGQLTVETNGLVSLVGTGAVLVANDVTVAGGDVEIVNGIIYCGETHPGAMTMSNGTANAQITYVGYDSQGTLSMLAGQMTVSSLLDIGFAAGSTGSVWMSGGQLTATTLPITIGNSGVGQFNLSGGALQASTVVVGNTGGPGGMLTVNGGTLTVSTGLNVGSAAQSTGTVWVGGGQLLVPSGSLVIGNGSGIGQMIISNGLVQANRLVLTNGVNSKVALIGGALSSGSTVVTNTQRFVVGNGSSAATFTMLGGVHSFGNGLEIANNGVFSGCGTISGNVTLDPGATVLASCGGTLTFALVVTNNGTMRAIGGSVLESYGTVVNNGTIDIINGSTSFHGAFVNNGTVVNAGSVKVSQANPSGQDFVVQVPSLVGHTYELQYTTSLTPTNWTNTAVPQPGTGGMLTFTDPGGATNVPARFYRVDCTAP